MALLGFLYKETRVRIQKPPPPPQNTCCNNWIEKNKKQHNYMQVKQLNWLLTQALKRHQTDLHHSEQKKKSSQREQLRKKLNYFFPEAFLLRTDKGLSR